MKIQEVKIKEFKCLKDIEKEIKGNNIVLMGDNGVGKSSFIQFIEIALGKQTNIPPNATGEGEVITDKNGNKYTFTVKFKDGKPVVTVTSPDGLKDARKGTIAGIVGALDFDIDEFVELSKTEKGRKQQVDIFKSFLSEDVRKELARFEANVKANYESRTEVNRTLKEKESAIKEHPLFKEIGVSKFEQVDTKEVYAQFESANETNNKIKDVCARMEQRKLDFEDKQSRILKLQLELDRLKDESNLIVTKNNEAAEWLTKKENQPIDLKQYEEKIKTASDTNKKFESAEQLKKDIALVEKLKEEAGELTAKVESEKQAILDAIRDMETPIQGLSFDNDQLIYNGIFVNPDSLSTSEIMELGIRLKMAENPELGILFIQRGESLGAKRLQEIQAIADKAGWQIIMEQVERGKEKLHIEIMQA
jgi:energy-coupling factor transporter ATP-binding protein EcfA2